MKMQKRSVRDIMSPIGEYNQVSQEDRIIDVLKILKENYEKINACVPGSFHKTLFVTDDEQNIVGQFSIFDLIRGLVPEDAKEKIHSRSYYAMLSSRVNEAVKEVEEMQERFKWLKNTFPDLVKMEAQKKVKDVMAPIHPLLKEDDTINKAIYIMFKENIRQPIVIKDGEIVGVVSLMDIFPLLLEIALEV
jgi:CBS domain-containing protein